MAKSKYEHSVSFHIDGPPPWKGSIGFSKGVPSSDKKELIKVLQREARRVEKNDEIFFSEEVSLEITYVRAQKSRDAANIIGGIADALQGILYTNDSKLVEVHYTELDIRKGNKDQNDQYWIKVAKVS